jgi:transcriptional regulator with XRE-family HTH domain
MLGLPELLRTARGRLRPADVGLPSIGNRRVPGLRKSEVAELAGVSTRWYEQFEAGTSNRRFSVDFVERIANALQLDDRERVRLFQFALPEIHPAIAQFAQSSQDGAVSQFAAVRSLIRKAGAASTFEEILLAAEDTVNTILAPSSLTGSLLLPNPETPQVLAVGRRADVELDAAAIAAMCMTMNYPNRFGSTTFSENRAAYDATRQGAFEFQQKTATGDRFVVDVGDTPTAPPTADEPIRDVGVHVDGYWDWNSKLEIQSTLTTGLFRHGEFRGNLVAVWTEPRVIEPFEIEAIRTVSAIVELAAR